MAINPSLYMNGENQVLRFYHYYPNKPLCIASLAVYAVFCLFLTFRVWQTKSAKFLYILAFTALMEVIGYAVRLLCISFTDMGRYIGTTLFLLLAPNALALVNYKAVGEIIRLSNVETDRFYLKAKFVTWFFFGSDIFSFVLQGAGGGLQTIQRLSNIGRVITLVGLVLQLGFFASFAGITVYVHRSPKYNYYVEGQPNAKRNLIRVLYITIILLYVRSIYRVAEYASGYDGPIAILEWAFYVFDTLVIAISFIFYCVFFIGSYLPKHNSVIGDDKTQVPISSSSLSITQTEKGGAEDIEANNKQF
ncbi:unnamed protein product [Mucor hiemalis]